MEFWIKQQSPLKIMKTSITEYQCVSFAYDNTMYMYRGYYVVCAYFDHG